MEREPEGRSLSRHCSLCRLCAYATGLGLLVYGGRGVAALFHWAEKRINRHSPWHAGFALLVTLPFNVGLPIPMVHQVWSVGIGCCFGWRAFPLLAAMLAFGVVVPFLIGRRLARSGMQARVQKLAPRAIEYLNPLRRVVAAHPVRASFLLMWTPLPTSSLPLIVGFLIPHSELRLGTFFSGAFPSKYLHFAMDVCIGLQAGSLAAAFDAHDDLPGAGDLDGVSHDKRRARMIAIGTMGLTLFFMGFMVRTMHVSLRDMRAKEAETESSV